MCERHSVSTADFSAKEFSRSSGCTAEQEKETIWDCKAQPTTTQIFLAYFKLVVGEIFSGCIVWGVFLANGIYAGRLGDPINLAVVGLAGASV